MLKIRRPLGRLIFNTGIAIPGKTVFLIETAPRFGTDKTPQSLPYCASYGNVLWVFCLIFYNKTQFYLLHSINSCGDQMWFYETVLRLFEFWWQQCDLKIWEFVLRSTAIMFVLIDICFMPMLCMYMYYRCVVMVGLPYPNMRSPELKEKMDYLNATLVCSGFIMKMITCIWKKVHLYF